MGKNTGLPNSSTYTTLTNMMQFMYEPNLKGVVRITHFVRDDVVMFYMYIQNNVSN